MIEHYIELLPIAVVGLFAGGVSFFNEEKQEGERQTHPFKVALKSLITSSFLCVIIYATLSATDLPYLARVGISAAIGFFGVEKAISLAKELLSFKNGKSKEDT